MGPGNHVLDGVKILSWEAAFLREDMYRPMVTYLRMANVPALRTRWKNPFAAVRGDMTRRRCGLLPNCFGNLFSF